MQQYCDFLKYQGHSVFPRSSQQQLQEASRLDTYSCPCLANLHYNELFDPNTLQEASVPLTVIHGFCDDSYGMRYEISPFSPSITNCYNPPIDESLHFPHNKEKVHYVEDNSMSFVGMFAVEDGVIAFGDTRSTITNVFGVQHEEKGRVAKKVFEGKDFLLTTWGTNRFHSSPDQTITMEDFIEKNIGELTSLELLSFLAQEIAKDPRNHSRDFYFGIGYKLNGKYVVQEAMVKENHLSFLLPNNHIWVGVEFYRKQCFFPISKNVDNAFEEIQRNVKQIMAKTSSIEGYNPAGSPFYFGMLGDYSGMVEIGKF